MGVQKNAIYKVHNGTDFDEINFKTTAGQVKTAGGSDVETLLAEITNEALITANGWWRDKKTGLLIHRFKVRLTVNQNGHSQVTYTLPVPYTNLATMNGTSNVECYTTGNVDWDIYYLNTNVFINSLGQVTVHLGDPGGKITSTREYQIGVTIIGH